MRKPMLTLMLLLSWGLTALAWAGGLPAPRARKTSSRPAAAATNVPDTTITKDVEARLARMRSLKNVPIHVETQNGVVTLTGTVRTAGSKGVATRETRMIAGVKRVNNQLNIAPGGIPHRKKALKHATGNQ